MNLHKEIYGGLRPLSIGFDDVFNRLDQLKEMNSAQSFPPYNIIQIDEETFNIELAIAGYDKDSVSITRQECELLVEGQTAADNVRKYPKYIHKGISGRNFKRSFALAEDVEVIGASFENGILTIGLKRIVPEEKKPQKIEIV